jgi:hypothetical protein
MTFNLSRRIDHLIYTFIYQLSHSYTNPVVLQPPSLVERDLEKPRRIVDECLTILQKWVMSRFI